MQTAARGLLVLVLIFLGACTSAPFKEIGGVFKSKGEPQLQAGIRLYEDGRYPQAARSFESALQAGLGDSEKVTAHKYLAFINCASNRREACRGHFRTALKIDPAFELEPAEAGHPMWGPVFRSVKARR